MASFLQLARIPLLPHTIARPSSSSEPQQPPLQQPRACNSSAMTPRSQQSQLTQLKNCSHLSLRSLTLLLPQPSRSQNSGGRESAGVGLLDTLSPSPKILEIQKNRGGGGWPDLGGAAISRIGSIPFSQNPNLERFTPHCSSHPPRLHNC